MQIRSATVDDFPAIVDLLKISMGEQSSPKTVQYWRWKHFENPFGVSPVFIAEDSGKIVGVRAMMRWNWKSSEKIFSCLRAVDTATHPEYQGKGVFRKLTLELLKEAQVKGFDFVFNTPNEKSRPGYLKMGWRIWGNMPLWILPVLTFKSFNSILWDDLCKKVSTIDMNLFRGYSSFQTEDGLITPITPEWLKWRYAMCPAKKYGLFTVYSNDQEVCVFFGIKERKCYHELRIETVLFSKNSDLPLLTNVVSLLARKLGCNLVTIGGLGQYSEIRTFLSGWFPVRKWSIPITVKPISGDNVYEAYLKPKKWLIQTGDLELF